MQTNAQLIFLFVSVAAISALPDTAVPEDSLSPAPLAAQSPYDEAKASIDMLIQQGNDQGACADLAQSALDEVTDTIDAKQKALDAVPTGDECSKLGQPSVDAANDAVAQAQADMDEATKQNAAKENAIVDFQPISLASIHDGECGVMFRGSNFDAATQAAQAAKEAVEKALGALNAAQSAVSEMEAQQKRAQAACLCEVREKYNEAWEAAQGGADANAKAWTKAKHMQCVLDGTPPDSCSVGAVPAVAPVTLAEGVPATVPQGGCGTYGHHMKYLGCFNDNYARDLKHGPKNYGYNPESCHDACKDYKYIALQNGGWCNCDNSYSDNWSAGQGRSNYDQISDSKCNKGGKGQGGAWANAVYSYRLEYARNPTPNPTPVPTPNPTPVPTPNPTPVPTPNPTPVPTPNPTPFPTYHPCISGSHNCDTNGGVCAQQGAGYKCTCKGGYKCTRGCSGSHSGHTCLKTPSPTPVPTPRPTPVPTSRPTPTPTNPKAEWGACDCKVKMYFDNHYRGSSCETTKRGTNVWTASKTCRHNVHSVKMSSGCQKMTLRDDDDNQWDRGSQDKTYTGSVSDLPYDLQEDLEAIVMYSKTNCCTKNCQVNGVTRRRRNPAAL